MAEDDKIDRFKETLVSQPGTWFHSITDPNHFDAGHPATKKKMFFTRWSLKGKTANGLYAEWQNFAFDPSKDDIEEFIGDIIQILTQLGYLESIQVMAIGGVLPTDT